MCDREKAAIDAQQYGFIDFVVERLFVAWSDALTPEAIAPCLDNLKSNKEYYKSRIAPPPGAAPPTPAAHSTTTPSTPQQAVARLSTTSSPITFIQSSNIPFTPWSNGGGSTKQLTLYPSTGSFPSNFLYRISSATIASDGPFSRFDGFKRLLVAARGSATLTMTGDGDDTDDKLLEAGGAILAFDGATPVNARITPASDGTKGDDVVDVGLIYSNTVEATGELITIAPNTSKSVQFPSPQTSHHHLVLLSGHATAEVIGSPSSTKYDLAPIDAITYSAADAGIATTVELKSNAEEEVKAILFKIQLPKEEK